MYAIRSYYEDRVRDALKDHDLSAALCKGREVGLVGVKIAPYAGHVPRECGIVRRLV